MVVMEDVTEEERSAELYVSVHGGLDHTSLERGGEGEVSPFQTKSAKSYLLLPNVFGLCALAFDIYVRITLSTEGKSESWTCNPRAISGFCRSNLPCDWVKKKSRTMVTKELSPLLNLMVLGRSPSTLLMRPLTKPSLSSPGLPPSLSKLLPK